MDGGKTLRAQILRNMLFLTGFALSLLAGSAGLLIVRSGIKQAEDSARTLAVGLASQLGPSLSGPRDVARTDMARLFHLDDILYAALLAPDGTVFAQVGDQPTACRPFRPGPAAEVEWTGGRLLVRVPVEDEAQRPCGGLMLALDPVRVHAGLVHACGLLLAATALILAAVFCCAREQARRLGAPLLDLLRRLRPLSDLREGGRPGSSGGSGSAAVSENAAWIEEPLLLESADRPEEVTLLARVYGEMAARLRSSCRVAVRQKRSLKRAVRARTEELRRKNAALAFQNEQVLEVSRLKSEFLATMSHELRTPLNAILALSELLRDEVSGPLANDEQRRQVAMIRESGEGLLRLINDVLDLSRIEAGRLELRRAPTDVTSLLVAAVEEMRPLAVRKGLHLHADVAEGPELWIDPDRIRQVLLNLLSNAVKFTDRGQVRVTGRLDPVAERITIEVADTGGGIAPSDHERVFQEFRQVDGSTTRRHGGSGLGLAITRRLVRLMGGEVHLSSDLGQGSVFSFWVPAWRECPSSGAAAGLQGTIPRVVLVAAEDRPELAALRSGLSRQGIEVRTFTGPAAFESLEDNPAAVIVLALPLAGVSALEALERIPSGLRRPAILVCAGKELSQDEWRSLEGRVDRIMGRGCPAGVVVEEIRRLVEEPNTLPVAQRAMDARDAA